MNDYSISSRVDAYIHTAAETVAEATPWIKNALEASVAPGLSDADYKRWVRIGTNAAVLAGTSLVFHQGVRRILPLSSRLIVPFEKAATRTLPKIVARVLENRKWMLGYWNGALSLAITSAVYAPAGLVTERCVRQLEKDRVPHAAQLAAALNFVIPAHALLNPKTYLRLYKENWHTLPKVIPVPKTGDPDFRPLWRLRNLARKDYIREGWSHWRRYMSVSAPGRLCQLRSAIGIATTPLMIGTDYAIAHWEKSLYEEKSNWAEHVGYSRILLSFAMGYLMYYDSKDGQMARAGNKLWEKALHIWEKKGRDDYKTFHRLNSLERRALARFEMTTPEGSIMDAGLDKLLMNSIILMLGAKSVYDGDVGAAMAWGGYGQILKLDAAKNAYRTAVNKARDSTIFTDTARSHYGSMLGSEYSGKYKTGALMTAAVAAFVQVPFLDPLVDAWAKDWFGERANSRDMTSFIAKGAMFFALNASRSGKGFYQSRAERVARERPFDKNLTAATAPNLAQAKALQNNLDGAIAQFKSIL